MASVKEFLEALFSPKLNGSFIEIRLIKPGTAKSIFFKDINRILENLRGVKARRSDFNVYFGVCGRSRRAGGKDAIKVVQCLWADLDAKDLDGDKEKALKRLREFPCPPSIIVDSGHGYHPYWIFKEPVEIATVKDVANVETYLKALSNALGADQSAAELARVLRLPDTLNIKEPDMPVPVKVVHFEPDRQYNLSDFDSFLSLGAVEPIQRINPAGWIRKALANLKDGNRNVTFAEIGGRLNRNGWSPEDIIELLTPHAEKCQFPVGELRQEIEGLCRRYPVATSSPSLPYNGGKTETELRPFEAIRLCSFLEQAPMEIAWIIDGILPREGAGIIASPAGYGKSWMLLDLGIEFALGGKWLGQFPTSKGIVLYLDEESAPTLLCHRIRKLLCAKKVTADKLDIHLAVGQGLSFSDQASVERLHNLLTEIRPALVIIDSLIRVHGAEENSASEMSQVFRRVKDLIREFGCTFLFADHQRKPGQFSTSQDLLLRGSSEKVAFVDTLLSLKRKDETLIVEHSKSRYAQPIPAFVVSIEDTGEEATKVVYGGEAEEIRQAARLEEANDFLASALRDGDWVARRELVELAKEAGISEKALDEALKALSGHQIEREDRKPETGRGGKAAFYRLKENAITFPFPDGETETETETCER